MSKIKLIKLLEYFLNYSSVEYYNSRIDNSIAVEKLLKFCNKYVIILIEIKKSKSLALTQQLFIECLEIYLNY